MMIDGQSRKMAAELGCPIRYTLQLGDDSVDLNEFIGADIQLSFMNQITCIDCGRMTQKSFAQGFCFPCMRDSPQNSECIIRPELCRGHLGEGRDTEWEQRHHVCEHIVYLATSSAFKVGMLFARTILAAMAELKNEDVHRDWDESYDLFLEWVER